MPDIKADGSVRWFRPPDMKVGDSSHGWTFLGLVKDPESARCEGILAIKHSDKSMRLDNSSGKSNSRMEAEFKSYIGTDACPRVKYEPGILTRFVKLLKGLEGFCAPTALMVDEETWEMKEGYEGWEFVGTKSMEDIVTDAFAAAPEEKGKKKSATTEELVAELAKRGLTVTAGDPNPSTEAPAHVETKAERKAREKAEKAAAKITTEPKHDLASVTKETVA